MSACRECLFWQVAEHNVGYCRRYPPQTHVVGFQQPSLFNPEVKVQPQPILHSAFPTTHAQAWCGDFQPLVKQ